MDLNLVVLAGKLAAPPEVTQPPTLDGARLLMTVQSTIPGPRLDVIPVGATKGQIPQDCAVGEPLWVVGPLQRRFSTVTGRSRLEVVASHIERQTDEDLPLFLLDKWPS